MKEFEEVLQTSKAVRRFMQVERMSENDIYEFYLECYFSYRDMFIERIRFGYELQRIIQAYKTIPEFKAITPENLMHRIFKSSIMHNWFAVRFWLVIENQVRTGRIDRGEALISITFINQIPATETMEEILNESKIERQENIDTDFNGPSAKLETAG